VWVPISGRRRAELGVAGPPRSGVPAAPASRSWCR
jgi:hypothetical protein